MRPYEAASFPLSIQKICSAAGIDNLPDLGRWPKHKPCCCWLLGECKEKCPSDSDHLGAGEVDEGRAKALCAKLAPGIKKLLEADVESGPPPSKWQKKGRGN